MRPTSRFTFFLAVAFLLTLTACSVEGASASGKAGSCENELFPVKQGAIWNYASAGGPHGTFTYTDTITKTYEDGFALDTEILGQRRAQEWRCLSDGLQALQIGGASAAGISTQDMTSAFTVLEVSGLSLPRKVSPGLQWQYVMKMQGTMVTPDNQQSPSSGSYSVLMQELGKDTIAVSAGVFEAVRFQANSSVDVMMDFEGLQVPVQYNGVTMIWYAPGVGFIKSVENGDFGGTAFSITTELQSYNIP